MQPNEAFRMTAEQGGVLALVRQRIAEKGYAIFPVAAWYQRHPNEFVAVRRANTHELQNVVLVRPQKNGSILIRPYWHGSMRTEPEKIAKVLRARRVFWRCQNLRRPPGGNANWQEYLTPEARQEYARLMW